MTIFAITIRHINVLNVDVLCRTQQTFAPIVAKRTRKSNTDKAEVIQWQAKVTREKAKTHTSSITVLKETASGNGICIFASVTG